jgi:PAS domain S-box-containing protein
MNALARIRAWLASSVAADLDRGLPIAETVQWVSLVYGSVSLLTVVAILLSFPEASSWRVATALGCVGLNALALALVRYEHPRAGALVLVSSCWLSLLLALAMTRGLSMAAQSGLVLAICSAGLLLGRTPAFALAFLSALAGPVFGGMQLGVPAIESAPHTYTEGLWLMQALIFFSAAALVSITAAHAERALARSKRSESRFRAIAESMQDFVVEFDAADRVSYANPVFLARRNVASIDALAERRLGDLMHPDDRERVTSELRRVRDTGGTARLTGRVVRPNGEVATLDLSAGGILDEGGERRVVSVGRDVTAQRAVEDALRDSEERYRMLTEHAPDMIVEHDESGHVIYMNRAARERGPMASSATEFGEWNHPDDVEKCRKAFEEAMTLGRVTRLVHRMRHKDGNYRWVSSSGAPYRTSKGEMHLVGQTRDISEEVELQEQLRQAQKMEAIGRLAGGVAHDFNNLLTVIGGYAGLLDASAALDPTVREPAREIMAAAERAAGLTRQLLALSRRQLAKSAIVDLNAAARALEPMLRRTLPESIELDLTLDPELPPVEADPSQLDQILLNLSLNARDAMPARGRLRIETRRGEGGRSLLLLVSDTGVGMSEETRLRAFEPFFTTKPPGEGSGLGLSTTYGIVQQIGGSISLDSAPGCGTRVVIELPAASLALTPVEPATPPTAWPERDASLLLVEDDPAVRRLLTQMLEGSGYRVVAAANGDEALALADAGSLAVDLVLSDYVLPGISGVELCVALRRRFPELRILLMTGHADLPPGAAALPSGAELLGKPFTREQLEALLARQLSAT